MWSPTTHPYPQTKRVDTIDVYNSATRGRVEISDPYSWLEKDNGDEYDTWCAAQSKYTQDYLAQIPSRESFLEVLRKAWDFEKITLPRLKKDGYYYYSRNKTDPQDKLFRVHSDKVMAYTDRFKDGNEKRDFSDLDWELFFDPNSLSKDGTVALSDDTFSPTTSKYWAYQLSESGSDWVTLRVRTLSPSTETKEDVLTSIRSTTVGWINSEKGFFYVKYPEGTRESGVNVNSALYYHKIGTPQEEDVQVWKDETNPKMSWWTYHPTRLTTKEGDGKYEEWCFLMGSDGAGSNNLLYVTNLKDKFTEDGRILPDKIQGEKFDEKEWIKISSDLNARRRPIGVVDDVAYIKSNEDAPKGKIVAFNLKDPDSGIIEILPEKEDAVLSWATFLDNKRLFICYTRNVQDEIYLYKDVREIIKGQAPEKIEIGDGKTVRGFRSLSEGREFWAGIGGLTTPANRKRFIIDEDADEKEGKWWREENWGSTKVEGLDPDNFVCKQVWYDSKDGTKIPMFLVHCKSAFEIQKVPSAFIYGYGGFNISMTPYFNPSRLLYLQHYGGYLAIPSIRGGSEFGEKWHEGGMKEKKQNVFDDFIACAEFLQKEYGVPANQTVIHGGSNGGLLTMACANQRPELYGAILSDVGVHDMLKFQNFTIGHAWTKEYGSADDPKDFDVLIKYSPLHNVDKTKVYPPILIATADHDDRVVPSHSLKMIATLQHDLAENPNPLLVRLDISAGHGAGKPMEKIIQDSLDKFTFAAHAIGRTWIASPSH